MKNNLSLLIKVLDVLVVYIFIFFEVDKDVEYKDVYSDILDYINNLKYVYIFLEGVDSTLIRKIIFYLMIIKKRLKEYKKFICSCIFYYSLIELCMK